MDPADLLAALRDPTVLGHPADRNVTVVQTHASIVALVGDDVFKFKKPVDLEFLDYSTLERRQHFCQQEVLLNRRLAPDVYLGVAELRRDASGRLRLGGRGELVDVAVHMRRLPDAAALGQRLAAADPSVGPDTLRRLGAVLHGFHRAARRARSVSAFATFASVAANARQNFTQLAPLRPAGDPLLARLERVTEAALTRLHDVVERRARRDVACDTHGDLRLDHIYLFPERPPPDDLVILDCIEFNAQFRCADPIADLAFLVMDLHRVGRQDLADALLAGYFAAYTEPFGAPPDAHEAAESRELLPFYTAYRATVRAKVEAMTAAEPEVPAPAARTARRAATRLLLLALRELAPAGLRPCLALVAGLPGTGKSTLARALAADGFVWVRSDAVRKQLAGLSPETSARAAQDSGLYTPAWTARTYDRCRELADEALAAGQRVVVDANFRSAAQRAEFAALARDLGVPLPVFVCETDPATARTRLSRRTGDASDADPAVYDAARAAWEPVDAVLDAVVVDTSGSPEASVAAVFAALARRGLA